MAQAKRTGAKAGDTAAGPERLARSFRAVKKFQPVADRVGNDDQIGNMSFVGKGASAARDRYAAVVEPRRQAVERFGIGNFPAEKTDAFAAVGMDHDTLLTVIHAESQRRARSIHALQAEQTGAIAGPVIQRFGADADIT